MKYSTKLLIANCIPILVFAMVALTIGFMQFRSGLYDEKQGNLKSTALAAMAMYSSRGYGDYGRKADGNIWRGMNFNVSAETSIVDDLKKQTNVDVTFFFGETSEMTSITDKEGVRAVETNAMNFIRDAANGGTYRLGAALSSVLKTIVDNKYIDTQSFSYEYDKNLEHYKKEPSFLQELKTINPLINDNNNYSEEEMDALQRMIDSNNNITTESIEALGEGYGRQDKVWNYFTPVRVVGSSIGRANVRNGYVEDIFDYNVGDAYSDAVHKAYEKRMKKNGANCDYNTIRYIGQNIGMTSDIPDKYKIKTSIDVKDAYNWYTHSGTIKTQDELNDFISHQMQEKSNYKIIKK